MNEIQRDILRRCHVDLVQDLEPKHVLDRLYQDGILTDNDLELIQAEKSARGRCQVLLSMLPTRGPSAYGSFQRALRETSYSHLGDVLDKIEEGKIAKSFKNPQENDATDEKNVKSTNGKTVSEENRIRICEKCKTFLEAKLEPVATNAGFICILRKYACLLMHNIEPKELIDEFYQRLLLNDDQCERIRVSLTRRDRCEVFFEELVKGQSECALPVLLKSLNKKYSYIVEKLAGAMKNKQNVDKSRKGQFQVLRKLRQIQNGTDVKEIDNNGIDSFQTVSEDIKLGHAPKEAGYVADSDKIVTYKETIESINDSGQNTRDLKKCEVNGSAVTSWKEQVKSTDLGMPDLILDFDFINVHAVKDDIIDFGKHSHEINHADETVNISFEEFSSSMLKESEFKFRSDSNDSLDQPDGAVMLTSHGSFNNKTNHSNGSVKKIGDKKGVKSKQSVSARKSQNSNNAKRKTTVSQNEEKHRPMNPDTNGSSENKNLIENDKIDRNKESMQIATLGSTTPNEPSKRLSFAFNHLSTLINEGNFERFDVLSHRLRERFPTDFDMQCIVGYLKTSRDLFLTNFDSAKQTINATMELVPKTSNPRYFTLELFTAKTRMYITQKKLEKLQSTLDDAMMILETDPVGCTGRAAGWLYINDARNQTAKLSVLNLSKPNALKVYEQLFERAKTSFKRSMTNFKNDGGKDGPFGFGYALCRLVILLLRCGDNGMTMNSLNPLPEDIDAAEQYLKNLEDSEIAMAKILDMHYRLAKCDYYFRRENTVRALENAEMAYGLASELQLLEFTEHAHNRLKFLRSRSKLNVKELNDDEVDKILFGESTETMSSHSD